ncbi:MAG: hypothetical protein HZB13_08145 [Acidobacteria bacterium]|nr:hypothetical protein [Acidobacteriota bacterium]
MQLLKSASPVFMDGGGPMPSFYWGRAPLPDLAEYYSHRSYFDMLYSLPYAVAGLVMTIIGCSITPLVVRRLRHPWSGTAMGTAVGATAASFALLSLAALASDVGSLMGAWSAPRFYLSRDVDLYRVVAMTKILVPTSLLSGAVAAWGRWAVGANRVFPG